MRLNILCHDTTFDPVPVVGLDWYNGTNGNVNAVCSNLAITFENGKTQLMYNESDTGNINDIIIKLILLILFFRSYSNRYKNVCSSL